MSFSTFTTPTAIIRFTALATLRGWISKRAAKAMLSVAVLTSLLAPTSLAADIDRSEYEEWGLTPPPAAQTTPRPQIQPATQPNAPSGDEDADWSEQLGPANTELAIPSSSGSSAPAQQATPAETPALATGPAVPADIAAQVEGAAVRVIAVDANGEHLVIPGWLIDRDRGIVMTMDFVVEGATQVYVAFPETTESGREFNGGPATLLQTNNADHIAYLQVQDVPDAIRGLADGQTITAQRPAPIPTGLPQGGGPVAPKPAGTGHGHGGRPAAQQPGGFGGFGGAGFGTPGNNPAASQNSQLLGQWFLQDVVNGTQIQMGAAFNAQGQFSVQVLTVSPNGQQSQDSETGTYTVQGNTLLLQTSDGIEQAPFWFEGGYLYIQLPSMGTTFAFQQAA